MNEKDKDKKTKRIIKNVKDEILKAIEHDEKDLNQMSPDELDRWLKRLLHEFWEQ